jgi:hypothetical protein
MPADTEENSHSPNTAVRNPYVATVQNNPYVTTPPTYKDILLSDAKDSSNRLGINTFKVLHLLHKKRLNKEQDTLSVDSASTDNQANTTTLTSYRMRFQTTLQNTTQESIMEDLASQINEVLEIININTPGIKLAPWHNDSLVETDMISELSESPLDAVRYLYGFKAGSSRSGTQYFRIRMAFPTKYSPDDIVNKNKGSIMIPGKQALLKANSQSINPSVLGWFFRSNPTMVDFPDLENVLKTIWSVKDGFGLYWAAVKDGKPYDATSTARAIHIETEESNLHRLSLLAEKTYGQASKKWKITPSA